MQIEHLNQMLITICVIAIRNKSAADDDVINYRGQVLQYVRRLLDSHLQPEITE